MVKKLIIFTLINQFPKIETNKDIITSKLTANTWLNLIIFKIPLVINDEFIKILFGLVLKPLYKSNTE